MVTQNFPAFMGVDYGSKLAGTTAAAMLLNGQIHIWQSANGEDADVFLLNLVTTYKPASVFIDAPLTLPKVYSQLPYTSDSDFFYRACDREVQAMSPMFIGGLTARAIKLRTTLAEQGIALLETYPSQLAKLLFAHQKGYKKDLAVLPNMAEQLQGLLNYKVVQTPANWHQFDALLAWFSGYRHLLGDAELYGDANEGRIIV